MFKGLGQIASLLKNAKQMSGQFQEMQESLKTLRVTGSAGGGLVTVEVGGEQRVTAVNIDPSLLAGTPEKNLIEDLVAAAMNDALVQLQQAIAQNMPSMGEGMDLSSIMESMGMSMPGAAPSSADPATAGDDDAESDDAPNSPAEPNS